MELRELGLSVSKAPPRQQNPSKRATRRGQRASVRWPPRRRPPLTLALSELLARMALSSKEEIRRQLNLKNLQRHDPAIDRIVSSASYASVYDNKGDGWVRSPSFIFTIHSPGGTVRARRVDVVAVSSSCSIRSRRESRDPCSSLRGAW